MPLPTFHFRFVAVLLIGLVWCQVPNAWGEIILNEVLASPEQDWDGDGQLSFKGDEWIEVLNIGYDVEDLSVYFLRDVFGTDPHLRLSGLLRPGETAVFYGSEAMAWQLSQGYSDYGFALNNYGETVELLRELGHWGSGLYEVIDAVTLQVHETAADRSSGWGQEGDGWILFDAWNVYTGAELPLSSACIPTPGDLNFCRPLVPVERQSWNLIKSYFR